MQAEKKVRDVMHPGVFTCSRSATLTEAARLMQSRGVRALVVMDEQCGMVGIVSQSDLVNAGFRRVGDPAWRNLTVEEAMTRQVVTVSPDDPITRAAALMIEHRIHRLVVVDADDDCKPIGVLSMGDLLRDLMQEE